jgi:2-dehydro-3-deoxyphosphogluconate aldolase/(4S)-4-hydroxy-2-oxoglutarate aldolase
LRAEVAGFAAHLEAAAVVGVLRAPSAELALTAVQAAVRGGLRAVEVTFTTPGAETVLRELASTLPEGVLLGAGTVLDAPQAEAAVENGAAFLVSPHLGEDVLVVARRHGVPYLPGVLTPTEIVRALRLGAAVLKVFPVSSAGGAGYLRDLWGPFPDLRVMVTGGRRARRSPRLPAGRALAVGLGSNLFPKDALAAGDADAVERTTREALRQAAATP